MLIRAAAAPWAARQDRGIQAVGIAGFFALVLVGCGGRTTALTGTVASPKPSPPAATSSTPFVRASVITKAVGSIAEVECANGGQTSFLGSGFVTTAGLVTASHVVGACVGGALGTVAVHLPDLRGEVQTFSTVIRRDDPTDDLALLQLGTAEASLALPVESTPVKIGDPVSLIGFPGGDYARPMVTEGTVSGTNQPRVLTSSEGIRETIRDAITVAAAGVRAGESGGAVINSAGRVVGVIEGASGSVAILTPIADAASLS